MQYTEIEKKLMERCITLAQESFERGDNPFGALVVKNGKIVAESHNQVHSKEVSAHAEMQVMYAVQQLNQTTDLSEYEIYSNCEPCPMCSFMIRELKFKKVVFAMRSPYMGGFTRWDILQDKGLEKFTPVFNKPPVIVHGILEREAVAQFEAAGWTIHKK